MAKDFTKWHKLKIKLEEKKRIYFFHEREIWWCSIGVNLGYEEDGKNEYCERPVLILRKFSKDYFWGLPLTSKKKKGIAYFSIRVQGKENTVLLWQLRLLSSKRLLRKMEKIPDSTYEKINCRMIDIHKK